MLGLCLQTSSVLQAETPTCGADIMAVNRSPCAFTAAVRQLGSTVPSFYAASIAVLALGVLLWITLFLVLRKARLWGEEATTSWPCR